MIFQGEMAAGAVRALMKRERSRENFRGRGNATSFKRVDCFVREIFTSLDFDLVDWRRLIATLGKGLASLSVCTSRLIFDDSLQKFAFQVCLNARLDLHSVCSSDSVGSNSRR